MPVKLNMPAPVNTTREAALLAQYMPNLGQDIMTVGKIMSAEADKVPDRLQALSTEMDIQEKIRQRNEAIRAQDFIKNNPELVEGIYKQAYNGQYGSIDFTQLPYWMRESIRKNAASEDKAGGERRKTEADITKSLAQTGLAGLQSANERLKLKKAEREEADALASEKFFATVANAPIEVQDAIRKVTSGDGQLSAEGWQTLREAYPEYRNPFNLLKDVQTVTQLKPVNTQVYDDLKTNLEAATEMATSAAKSTNLGIMSLGDWAGFKAQGRSYIPHGVGEADWKKYVENGPLVEQATKIYQEVLQEHPEYTGLITPEMAIYAAIHHIRPSRWYEFFTPGTTSLGNGTHINTRNRNFIPWSDDTIENQQGSIKGSVLQLAEQAYKNQRMASALHPSAGVFPKMRQILEQEIKTDLAGYAFNKKTATKEQLIERALPKWLNALAKAGLNESEARSIISTYISQLKGEPASFSFVKNN